MKKKLSLGRLLGRKKREAWRNPEKVLMELSEVVGLQALEEAVAGEADRRLLISRSAEIAGISEALVQRRLAGRLGTGYLDTIPPLDLVKTKAPPLSQLRRMAAVPVEYEGKLRWACVDPGLLPAGLTGAEAPLLATWAAISQALEQAEQSAVAQTPRTLETAIRVLGLIVKEASSFGARTVRIAHELQTPVYEFVAADGRRGRGTIDPSLRDLVTELLRDREQLPLEEGTSVAVTLDDGAFVLTCGGEQSVPVEAAAEEPAAAAAAEPEPEPAPLLLLVDRNELFLRVLERFFVRFGMRCCGARTLEEVYAVLRREGLPQAAVVDVSMDSAEGRALLGNLRSELNALPLIALSSDQSAETHLQALALGADVFVPKTEDPRVLYAYVARALKTAPSKGQAA